MRSWLIVAALVLAVTPAAAQRGLIQEGDRMFPAPPAGLAPPPLTQEAIVAARGNLARWRDAERVRLGPYSRENEIANAAARKAYFDASWGKRRNRRETVPEPTYLPVGTPLPALGGYFAYFYSGPEGASTMTIVSATWRDRTSNAGEPSAVNGLAMLPDTFCGMREMPLGDVTYLGPVYTPEMAALNRAWLGPRTAPLILFGSELSFSRTPTGGVFARYYPERALARGIEGTASMLCDIGATATLTCTPTSEKPEGWGFGAAALRVAAEGYVVSPELRDGTPAAGRKVCMSTAFRLEN